MLCPGHLTDSGSGAAAGGTEKPDSGSLRKQGQGGGNFLRDVPAAHGLHGVVAEPMAADLVARLHHPRRQLRVLPDAVAAEEKSGLYVPGLQAIQQPPGEPSGGTVIEGQGQGGLLGGNREDQGRKQQKQGK